MLMPRIIPCLLVHNGGLVKTFNFSNPKYVGDPVNAVKIFNEKEVDELTVLDIDATVNNKEPDYNLITKLATECRMPLCYGGGVKNVDQVEKIIGLGVEKVSISSAAIDNPDLITKAGEVVGTQSIVVVLDVKKNRFDGNYKIYTHNGQIKTRTSVFELAEQAEKLGAGELVINSIDRDGAMSGYDIKLASIIREKIQIPMTVLGGVGSLEHIGELIQNLGTIGAAAGSFFVFKGRYKAVLISYPSHQEKEILFLKNKGPQLK